MGQANNPNPFGEGGAYGGGTLVSRRVSSDPRERGNRELKQLEQARYALNAQIAAKRQQLGLPQEIFITQEEAANRPPEVELIAPDMSPAQVLQWLLDYGVDKKKAPILKKYLEAAKGQ